MVSSAKSVDYLVKKKDRGVKSKVVPSTDDFAACVKRVLAQLVMTGMEPSAAAAKAIEQATLKDSLAFPKLEVGLLSGTSKVRMGYNATVLCQLNNKDMTKVLTIAKKYVTNVQNDPSNPRFQYF